jgi:glycosyl transferase family 87
LLTNSKIGVVLALLFAASMCCYVTRVLVPYQRADAAAHQRPRGNLSDLYPRWFGARELLLHHRNPYDPEVTREIQVGYYGRELDSNREADPKDRQAFAYPAYVAFLLAPTLGLPFETVMTGFKWLLILLTATSVLLWLRAVDWHPGVATKSILLILTLGSFPAIQGFKLQQLSLVVAALVAASAALLVSKHFLAAGILLSLSTIKPQLVLPLMLCLLLWTVSDWSHRQRFFWGFVLGMAALVGGAEIVLPGWIGDFLAATRDYRRYTGGKSLLDTLLSPSVGRLAALAALLFLLAVAWRLRRGEVGSREFSLLLAIALAITLIVIPMFAPYNQLLLLPAILLVVREWPELWKKGALSKAACVLTVAIVGWPWFAALGLTLASLTIPAASVERGWAVPLSTSLGIPLVILVQLASLLARAERD